jgi:hypothetical protein
MASLQQFIAQVNGEGLMRSSRFSVFFSLPNAVTQGIYTTDLRKVLLYCDTITLPGLSFATAEAKTYGEIREMPYQRLFETVPMTFYMDNSMSVKLLFDSWMAGVVDPGTRTMNYYNDYITDMSIIVYDTKDNSRYQVNLYQCYPKAIGAVQMDYASKDVMKMSVTMICKYWDSNASQQNPITGSIDPAFLSNLGSSAPIPNAYFTNFQNYQSSVQSFENTRTSLFTSSNQSTGFGGSLI